MLSTLISACTTKVQEKPYAHYIEASSGSQSAFTPVDELPRLAPFVKMMREFSAGKMSGNITAAYAETFYFNDTFHTLEQRRALIDYFTELAGKGKTEVTFLDANNAGDDFYVRWKMRMQFKALWREIDVTSVGLTHLRLDDNGKIVLHQDFWDGAEGFYAHLPVIGGQIKRIRSQLGQVD
ncbi:nuclear transport factor 2 family protein [Allohahella sp. A8]|uniref:nuclear transport factor 2 family protein n=1 Tax=Allohahella sp. A8 TaxID=3141461 RepID=UPI0026D86526|tara:strand:- start:14417 stop:14959 length:543 start_codon:yes stop_codon:yes gene_type:complete